MGDLPELLVPPGEARHLLEARIEKGREIQTAMVDRYPDREAVQELQAEFGRWHRYNEILLRKIFSGDEVVERYEHSRPVMMVRSLDDEVRALREQLRRVIAELEAVTDTVELLDVTDHAVPAASTAADRDAYFKELCKRSGGRADQRVRGQDIGAALGLSDDVRRDVEQFLHAEGLIAFAGLGPQVALTHAGRTRFEQGGSAVAATSASGSVVILGSVTGETVQISGAGSSQSVTISRNEAIDAAREWIDELLARIDDGTLTFTHDDQDEARDYIEVVSTEVAKPDPSVKAIRMGLRSLGRVLEGAGGSVVASGLLEALPHIVRALT